MAPEQRKASSRRSVNLVAIVYYREIQGKDGRERNLPVGPGSGVGARAARDSKRFHDNRGALKLGLQLF